MTVYIDLVFILNFCVNYLLLRGTARLGASASRKRNASFASCIGAVYAVLVYLPQVAWTRHLLIKIMIAALMLMTAFGVKRSTLRLSAVFIALSLALCGAVYAVQTLQGRPFLYRESLLYPVSFASLLLTAFAVCLACRLFLPRLTHAANSIVPLTLQLNQKTVHLTALRDSGNTLIDPISGNSVLTAHWTAAAQLLPEKVSEKDFHSPSVLALRLKKYAPRLIPYRAVGTEHGLLLAIPCKITLDNQTKVGLVAFSPTPLSDGGAYEALTGGSTYV